MDKKKGMIFGKLNVIDLAILLVIVAAVAFFAMKFMTTGTVENTKDTVTITYFEEECPAYVVEQTKVGDPVLDGTTNESLGVVTDVKVDDSVTYNVNQQTGQVTLGSKEGYVSAYITTQVEGTLTDNGVVIDGTLYSVGHSVVLHAGYGKYYLQVYSVQG